MIITIITYDIATAIAALAKDVALVVGFKKNNFEIDMWYGENFYYCSSERYY